MRTAIKRVAFVYLALSRDSGNRRMLEEKFILMPRLGLEYLCAVLQGMGIEAAIYDQVIRDFNPVSLGHLLNRDNVDIAGFYIVSKNLTAALRFIREFRENSPIPVISGGPGCNHYEELIDAGCEVVCRGEGEQTIREIIEHYEQGRPLREIRGIAYREEETHKIIVTSERDLIEDLDTLPFPLRTSDSIREYCHYLAYPLTSPCVTVIASRGCVNNCAFCTSYSFWRRKYRQRYPASVVKEVKQAASWLGARSVQFIDDVFAQRIDWLEEFCGLLKKEKLGLRWMCNLHPMTFGSRKKDAFLMMRDSGCTMISFGAQSADGGILKSINRDPDEPAELRKTIGYAKTLGITTVVTYIFGLPGETRDTMLKNLRFCLEVKPHMVDFHHLDIIPFSELSSRYDAGEIPGGFSIEQCSEVSKRYMFRYYLRTQTSMQLLADIARKNPLRFFTLGLFGINFCRRAG